MPVDLHTLTRSLDHNSRASNTKAASSDPARVTISLLEEEAQALVRLVGAVELDMDATSAIVSLAAQLRVRQAG